MSSAILKLASGYIRWIMIIFSLFVLLRGHNYPGGGFIGGVLASAGILFDALANRVDNVKRRFFVKPVWIAALGLVICMLAALPGQLVSNKFFKGFWIQFSLPFGSLVKLGTPLLFDFGIYLMVTGSILIIIFSIMEELEWK